MCVCVYVFESHPMVTRNVSIVFFVSENNIICYLVGICFWCDIVYRYQSKVSCDYRSKYAFNTFATSFSCFSFGEFPVRSLHKQV